MAKIAPVKGTRDFYPDQMAVRNWIMDGWRAASLRSGFVEYDGPIFEHLRLFTEKSGAGIVSELFSLTDRGGRELALRPEMTPTLARMVNQQINALSRPIKWFSMPRCCRAERPQKGRLREFFQWNVDIIAAETILADAECLYTALDYLRSVGLTADDIEARISSRSLLAALLREQGFAESELPGLYTLLDKQPKLPEATFAALAAERIPDPSMREKLMRLQAVRSLDELARWARSEPARRALAELKELFGYLEKMGLERYCRFDISIVRGLAYYTGPVFEVFDKSAALRAVCAGGRYDDLLAGLGGPQLSGTGFGMGDVVLGILLQEKGLLGAVGHRPQFFVAAAGADVRDKVVEVVSRLREHGFSATFDYRAAALGKQLKQAAAQRSRCAVILGRETLERQQVTLKDMDTGTQQAVGLAALLADPGRLLPRQDTAV